MSRDPDASVTLRHGDPLTLTCTIQLDPDPAVDSDVVVTGNLQGQAGSNSAPVMTSAGEYKMTLNIASLQATFLDMYTCTSSVEPRPGVMYVERSESHYSLNITVGKQPVSVVWICMAIIHLMCHNHNLGLHVYCHSFENIGIVYCL